MKKTIAILTFASLFISNASLAQVWDLHYGTDKTYIDNVFLGAKGQYNFFGWYRCDTCTYTNYNWLIGQYKDNNIEVVMSFDNSKSKLKYYGGNRFHFFSDDTIVAYANQNYFFSNDKGRNWNLIANDSVWSAPVLLPLDNNSILCIDTKIRKIEGKGKTIRVVKNSVRNIWIGMNPCAVSRKGKSIYVIDSYPIRSNTDTTTFDVLHSTDNGETWTTIPVPVAFKPWDYSNICIAQTKENEGFISITGPVNALSQYDYLMRFKGDSIYTNDHIIIDSFAKNNWIAITGMHFYNNCEGLITTFSEYHYKTADGGATWHRTEAAPALQFYHSVFIDSACVLYDGGFSSANQKTPLIVNFTNGGAPYPLQTGCVVKPATGVQVKVPESVRIYPNPFSETLTFELPQSNAPYKIDVYSITGQLLMQLEATSGKNVLNTSALANGMYVVQVYNNQLNFTQKLIK